MNKKLMKWILFILGVLCAISGIVMGNMHNESNTQLIIWTVPGFILAIFCFSAGFDYVDAIDTMNKK